MDKTRLDARPGGSSVLGGPLDLKDDRPDRGREKVSTFTRDESSQRFIDDFFEGEGK